jgi:hypothetical protein
MAACLERSFQQSPPTHHVRLTVFGMISDPELTSALGRFLSRLRYWLRKQGATFAYFVMNEWSDGQRHVHILVRTSFTLTTSLIGELWKKTLPRIQHTHNCSKVRSAPAIARYIVKHLKDDSKKELAPRSYRGRLFNSSRGFLTKNVAALWKELRREWFEAPEPEQESPHDPHEGSAEGVIELVTPAGPKRQPDCGRVPTYQPRVRHTDEENVANPQTTGRQEPTQPHNVPHEPGNGLLLGQGASDPDRS